MRRPLALRPRSVRFNITPLIDVVFLLVIFFLVASHFARMEPTEVVQLPEATKTREEEQTRRLTVTVTSEGTYSVQGNRVTLDDVDRMIAEGAGDDPQSYAVRIRGDRKAPYHWIEPLLVCCARHQVTTFGFKVLQE